jgi:hypothetical protein
LQGFIGRGGRRQTGCKPVLRLERSGVGQGDDAVGFEGDGAKEAGFEEGGAGGVIVAGGEGVAAGVADGAAADDPAGPLGGIALLGPFQIGRLAEDASCTFVFRGTRI